MLKIKRKIAYVALWLFTALSPPLQATQPHTARPDPDSRNYVNSYLVKVLNLRDISPIVIDYISSPKDQYFTSLLDLIIRLKYYAHAEQMIGKAGKETVLLSSAEEGYLASIKYLHQQGADIDAKDNYRNTALILSAWGDHLACVKYLVAQGADIHAKNIYGYTALLFSAKRGHLACVQYLVQKGADVNEKNIYGYTALILSAYRGHLACVKYLVEQGADIHATDKDGKTALALTQGAGRYSHVANYLRQQGARFDTLVSCLIF